MKNTDFWELEEKNTATLSLFRYVPKERSSKKNKVSFGFMAYQLL